MSYGKSVNKKSFYGGMEAGQVPDIEMPPLDQTLPIAQAAPNPWDEQQKSAAQQQQAFNVPDQLPQDTLEAMEESDRDETSQPQEQQPQERKPLPNESFKELRSAKERAEQERDLLLRKMMEMEQYVKQQQQVQVAPQDDSDADFDIDADALVEGKSLKKVASRIKKLEARLQESQVRNQMSASEARLRSQYPDMDQVLSRENIEQLSIQHPEIARTIGSTQDLYDKGVAAYTMIKNLGIHKDKIFEQDRVKAMANTQKPRPLASVSPQQGDSPLSKANAFANGLTDDLKEQLRKEMYAARRAM